MTEGYSMSGSQANSVALNPAGTFSGGKRFSVCGPVRGGSSPRSGATPSTAKKQIPERKRRYGVVVMGSLSNGRQEAVGRRQEAGGRGARSPPGVAYLRNLGGLPPASCLLPPAHCLLPT